MDSNIPTSFIPKDTIRPELRDRREPVGIVAVIALILLAGSLVYLAGVYAYRYMVYNEINNPCAEGNNSTSCGLRASLEIRSRELQIEQLEELKRLDTKLKNGMSVLGRHITLKPFFALLGEVTNQNIQYQKFQFDKEKNLITIEGVAKSYEDIAYQQKVFSTNESARKAFVSFAFSDFDLNQTGLVNFKLAINVKSELLDFNQQP